MRARPGLGAAALVVGLAVLGAACSSGDESSSAATASSTTRASISGPTTEATVPRDGDPEFCTAITDFQDAYRVIAEPAAGATPAQVEAFWDALAESSGRLTEQAPQDMAGFVQPVVAAFDQLRHDADAVGYEYDTLDDLDSSATLDPSGTIAQSAYAIFTYGSARCPEAADGTTTTTAAG